MRELITIEQADRLFLLVAFAMPVACLIIGWLAGMRRNAPNAGAVKGFLIGLLGPINFALWKIYNAITDRLGLDTVKNLLVNIGLFVGLGVVAGLVYGYSARNRLRRPEGGDASGYAIEPVGPAPTRGPGTERVQDDSLQPPREP